MAQYRSALPDAAAQKIINGGPDLAEELKSWSKIAPIAEMRLIVSNPFGTPFFKLTSYDGKGAKLFNAVTTTRLDETSETVPTSETGLREAPLSDQASFALNYAQEPNGIRPDWLLKPEEIEPLDVFVKEAVIQLSTLHPSKYVLFVGSDRLWMLVQRLMSKGSISAQGFQQLLLDNLGYTCTLSGETVIWKPKQIRAEETFNQGREALRVFATRAIRESTVSIENLASALNGATGVSPIVVAWNDLLTRSFGQRPVTATKLGFFGIKCLGALPKSQLQFVAAKIPVAPEGKALVPTLITGALSGPELRLEGNLSDFESDGLSALMRSGERAAWQVRAKDNLQFGMAMPSTKDGTADPVQRTPIVPTNDSQVMQSCAMQFLGFVKVDTQSNPPTVDLDFASFARKFEDTRFQTFRQDLVEVQGAFPNGGTFEFSVRGSALPLIKPTFFRQLPADMQEALWTATRAKIIEMTRSR
jgi:hypothetical protein